jgi:ubiquinone/menaquinone biosynthesis C-methylase UbiE
MADAKRVEEVASRESAEQARAVIDTVVRRISKLRPPQPGATFVEVGSAAGANVAALAEAGFKPTGVDIVEEFVELARTRHAEIPFVVAAAESLPFADDSFDYVLLLSVLEHVRDWRLTLAEAVRVLKPGGILYASTTNRFCPKQYEIRYLYGFGYLPSPVRRAIYAGAMRYRPALIHHTRLPAYHWFSFGQLARELRGLGTTPHHFLSLYRREDIPARFKRRVLSQLTQFATRHPVLTTTLIAPTTTVLAQKVDDD